ncbi:MAG: hypothetical protein Fur0010_25370 [Bdellovibrio sp.]
MAIDPQKLYDMVFKVNEKFYELIYNDSWLKNIFVIVDQKIITSQQTDFIVGALGGPRRYCGRSPADAHPHIFVDEEMWQLREKYLRQAFQETNFPPELGEKWIRIDEAFKSQIIKKDKSECTKRYASDEIIYFPYPGKKAA